MTALMEAMSEHPRVTYEEGRKSVSVDTSRVIFVLVSDVGAERLDAVVRSFKSRSDVVAVRLPFLCCSRTPILATAAATSFSLFSLFSFALDFALV